MNDSQKPGDPVGLPATLQGAFLQLLPLLQRCVSDAGYSLPTPVQEAAIPPILAGKDLVGTAQTGTGKTAAFVLPVLQRLSQAGESKGRGGPRVLILAPTRELAAQIGESISVYGRHLPFRHAVIFGGVSQVHQEKALRKGVDLLVATPGRLLDLMGQHIIRLDRVEVFILDEVDRMLDMGFRRDIAKVLREVPTQRQTLFFSATLSPEIERLAAEMVRNPVRVAINPGEPAVDRIRQRVLFLENAARLPLLTRLLKERSADKVIVFTQMKHVANRVVEKLQEAGIVAEALHGNKSQAARIRALDGFRAGRVQVLVATDVAARGLDVDDIRLVVNYDLPVESETYVHRIGRTARAGAEGEALSFCTAEDRAYLREIEKMLGHPVPADLDHPEHSESARLSTLKPPTPGNRGGGSRMKNRSRTRPDDRRGRQGPPGPRRVSRGGSRGK